MRRLIVFTLGLVMASAAGYLLLAEGGPLRSAHPRARAAVSAGPEIDATSRAKLDEILRAADREEAQR